MVLKCLFVVFQILTVDVPDKNDGKVDKIFKIFHLRHFLKNLMVSVMFEFEVCALMRSFLTLLYLNQDNNFVFFCFTTVDALTAFCYFSQRM